MSLLRQLARLMGAKDRPSRPGFDARFPDTSRKGTRRDRGLPVQRRPRASGRPLKIDGTKYALQTILDARGSRVTTGAVISMKREALRQGGAA